MKFRVWCGQIREPFEFEAEDMRFDGGWVTFDGKTRWYFPQAIVVAISEFDDSPPPPWQVGQQTMMNSASLGYGTTGT